MNFKIFTSSLFLILSTVFVHAQVIVNEDIDYFPESEYTDSKDYLDIYMPEGKKDVPVIVYFHGGALLMGNKSWGKDIGHKVAKSGIGLVSVNYRLSPGFQHPAHLQDAAAATAWVINNIEKYGGDPQNVYVAGHSAGAYLAALLSIDFSVLQAHEIEPSTIRGTILISPFLYVEETAKVRIERDSVYKTIWGNEPENWVQASVTPHILPDRNNILLIYADGDEAWRKEQNERFAKAMTDIGNLRVYTKEVPNRDHLTLLSKILDEDDRIVKLIHDFVMKEE
ncbi:alpha/beta hydrolase [Robiginitalea sp. IMCC44478]|uniref:alpha/beta hydrolase n=1 Tax=Robiginitalea sp. IMCC44478 TaxID=3459122 RepID=UPI00404124EA